MSNPVGRVVIGVDPHKLVGHHRGPRPERDEASASGRLSTDHAGYTAMRTYASTWPDRVWAVEGANGAGRPLAQRLLEAGENVVDVPAKLAARVRLFDTGHNRKTDALDAHSVAVVGGRTKTLRVLRPRRRTRQAMRMLADRREALTRRRVQTVCRLQALLAELLPGHAKKDLTAPQAKMLATVRPRDIAGKTRRRIAAEDWPT